LIQKFTRLRLEDAGRSDLADRIAPYRAGYTPQQRREIERRLAEGELLAVVATDALELGIDVGDLDAAICVTFPGTVASLRQMWRRAGRREPGLAMDVTGDLREKAGRYLPRGEGFPAARISLRSAGIDSVAVVDTGTGEMIGNVEPARAPWTLHPGAVYLHLGQSYEVRELDLHDRTAWVDRFSGDWYTQPKKETDTWIEEIRYEREWLGVMLSFGMIAVTEQVTAYQKKRVADHEVLDLLPVDLPEQSFVTQALWYTLPDGLLAEDFPLSV